MRQDQFTRTIELRDRGGRVTGTKEVVTYQGLLSKAHEEGLKRIATTLVQAPSEDNARTAIAKAEVETGKGRFEALGDASPENVNPFIVPHLIRMAETRAKARALRDAVNIGVISFEELDGEVPASESLGERARWRRSDADRSGGGRGFRGPQNGDRNAMSDGQRRFLFRILASQGLQGEEAAEHLRQFLAVESLDRARKSDAAALIDRLLAGEDVPVSETATP